MAGPVPDDGAVDESPENPAPDELRWPQGLSFLIACACVVIIVAGLRAAKPFFVPLSIAVFLSLFAIPLVRRLRRRGWREGTAVSSVIAGATKPEQVVANAGSAGWHLTSEDVIEIDALLGE